jgi:hypothetical protein
VPLCGLINAGESFSVKVSLSRYGVPPEVLGGYILVIDSIKLPFSSNPLKALKSKFIRGSRDKIVSEQWVETKKELSFPFKLYVYREKEHQRSLELAVRINLKCLILVQDNGSHFISKLQARKHCD